MSNNAARVNRESRFSAGSKPGFVAVAIFLGCVSATADSYSPFYKEHCGAEKHGPLNAARMTSWSDDLQKSSTIDVKPLYQYKDSEDIESDLQKLTLSVVDYLSSGYDIELGEEAYDRIEEAGGIWEFI